MHYSLCSAHVTLTNLDLKFWLYTSASISAWKSCYSASWRTRRHRLGRCLRSNRVRRDLESSGAFGRTRNDHWRLSFWQLFISPTWSGYGSFWNSGLYRWLLKQTIPRRCGTRPPSKYFLLVRKTADVLRFLIYLKCTSNVTALMGTTLSGHVINLWTLSWKHEVGHLMKVLFSVSRY